MPHDFAIDWPTAIGTILVGIVVNATCALVGCYLVLRRLSLLGDAISHGVLPGIALAFLFTGQITGWPILLGAMALGLATAWLTELLKDQTATTEDASLGVVFTSLFALGVILITYAARRELPTNTSQWDPQQSVQVDLDPGCVLYGMLDTVVLDATECHGIYLPNCLPRLLTMFGVVLGFILLFWKELKLATFDGALATALGYRPRLLHYLLMALVAAVAVTAFEAVGSILVIAMLIVPPATAQLLTHRLPWVLVLAVLVGVLSAVGGYFGAVWLNTSVAGMMAVAAGLCFSLAVVFSPSQGLVSQLVRRLALSLRIAQEDVLSQLYRREEQTSRSGHFASSELKTGAAPGWQRLAVLQLKRYGLIVATGPQELGLTKTGRRLAAGLVRTHRLWERYLEVNTALPLDHLHAPAERVEHFVGPTLREQLAEEVPAADLDPHGREIPKGP